MAVIFKFDDYRAYLKKVVEQKKQVEIRFGLHRLAEMAQVQRPYFSKVMARQADLSADQVFLLAEGLGLNADEVRYFELLVERDRTPLAARRKRLTETLERMAEAQLATAKNLNAGNETLGGTDAAATSEYYLEPLVQIVHVSLFIPRFAAQPRELASALRITPARLNEIIDTLRNMGLVAYEGSALVPQRDSLHLDKHAKVYRIWRSQLRILALQRMNDLPLEEQVSFSSVFSADQQTKRAIHERFLAFLRSCEDLVRDAQSLQTFQISFDLFPWT